MVILTDSTRRFDSAQVHQKHIESHLIKADDFEYASDGPELVSTELEGTLENRQERRKNQTNTNANDEHFYQDLRLAA